jgi:hypothetical protein
MRGLEERDAVAPPPERVRVPGFSERWRRARGRRGGGAHRVAGRKLGAPRSSSRPSGSPPPLPPLRRRGGFSRSSLSRAAGEHPSPLNGKRSGTVRARGAWTAVLELRGKRSAPQEAERCRRCLPGRRVPVGTRDETRHAKTS